jgi:hypothetical protein
MTDEVDEMSAASRGSTTHVDPPLTLTDIDLLYSQWKRMYCGHAALVVLRRRPKWKCAIYAPWLWWSHFRVACEYTTTFQAARLATLFVWAFLTARK